MQKYQKTVSDMMSEHKELFDNFKQIHDAYVINPEANRVRFNEVGSEVVDIIRDYERRLCGNMNRGVYGKFSQNLSQKFWDEIRKIYKKIDFVGTR
ncbi:hypothetical protein A2Z00_03090 [Candidatus Gottesmanbacteria bacterium RBG_13_45_10]|uniref:Uncharacterized protein n=1 Tax=Candidatus Gottesmanbacteria bacterium RBG_13_45_10 TaxID=1798370 RepID=A0A1F5ZII8_9BACT|nr:MAG: hypothetical protein A2Z00_03090 [Candidatus Gottesmanbacteria bacterium RBG_13_45_10]